MCTLYKTLTLFLERSEFSFHSLELRKRAEEVANLEKELRELQITAQRLVEKKNQNQKHFEQTEGRLQKQQKGKYKLIVNLCRLGGVVNLRHCGKL